MSEKIREGGIESRRVLAVDPVAAVLENPDFASTDLPCSLDTVISQNQLIVPAVQ